MVRGGCAGSLRNEWATIPYGIVSAVPDVIIGGFMRCGTTAIYDASEPRTSCSCPTSRSPTSTPRGPASRYVVQVQPRFALAVFILRGDTASFRAGTSTHGRGVGRLHRASDAWARIADDLPAVRMIVSLRNPIDRAYSAFSFLRATRREPLADFRKRLLDEEESRTVAGWGPIWQYTAAGQYGRHLSNLFELVAVERVHIVWFEDRERPIGHAGRGASSLGCDPTEPLDLVPANAAVRPRRPVVNRILHPSTKLRRVARELVSAASLQRSSVSGAGTPGPSPRSTTTLDPVSGSAVGRHGRCPGGLLGPISSRWSPDF